MTTHKVKCWPSYFDAVARGDKTFEVRYDDRGYQAGDTIVLCEWDRDVRCGDNASCTSGIHGEDCGRYTGRRVTARIGWVTASTPKQGNRYGFEGRGYVVLSLCDPTLEAPADRDPVLVFRPEHGSSSAPEAMAAVAKAGTRPGGPA
jgi:hypothetical protein